MEKSLSEEEEDGDTESEETETSQLILFGNDYFITDMQISSYYNPMVFIYNNADLFLNSVAYLTDNDEDITLRKNQTSSNVTFTATEGEQDIILSESIYDLLKERTVNYEPIRNIESFKEPKDQKTLKKTARLSQIEKFEMKYGKNPKV